MPAVKKMHQESENSTKREYVMAHLFGTLGIVIGNGAKQFCAPLSMTIQDGCRPILEWMGSEYARDSHVTCLVRQACKTAALMVKDCFLLMDRYFISVPALAVIAAAKVSTAGHNFITMITRAKIDFMAYEKPGPYPGRGRPRKKGKDVKLHDLFKEKADAFTVVKLRLYGIENEVRYYCVDLLWGRKLYQELRFVLTVINGVESIMVSTALDIHPETIILLYCYRFKIEVFFRAFGQCIAGLGYHFWNKDISLLDKFESAKESVARLAKITDIGARESIIRTYKAIEGFVMLCCIAIGTIQICALRYAQIFNDYPIRWLRTYTNIVPSEASVQICLRDYFGRFFNKCPKLRIVEIVFAKRAKSAQLLDDSA